MTAQLPGIKAIRLQLPPGILTRFTVPVTDLELEKIKTPTKAGNRRVWSFMNTVNAIGIQTTLEDWRHIAKREENLASKDREKDSFDVIPAIVSQAHVLDLEVAQNEIKVTEDHVYEAHLFCTDNDFLESAKTRAFFKSNALVADDAKLFEMPAVTSVDQTGQESEESMS